MVELRDYQLDALSRMKNGCILNGGVGSGKSLTSLAYYYTINGGCVEPDNWRKMAKKPLDLYIITTARKRDSHEWEGELCKLGMTTDNNISNYNHKIIIDSWNNVQKYENVTDAFFIFDEQRVVGWGKWSKAFIRIAQHNKWILLSATPGDTWMDYIPVFIANGFYKNKTDFTNRHVQWKRIPNAKYMVVDKYINTGKLLNCRDRILINMDFQRETVQHHTNVMVTYDKDLYKYIEKTRWNPWKNEPIQNAGEYCGCLRRCVNSDISRQEAVISILKTHPRAIIFYSYDYELEILRELLKDYPHAEWNGHKHEMVPTGPKWVYLVEYIAGSEAWNCITTNCTIFYSQNYSYKMMVQSAGRIDRMNTPYKDLYYYHFISDSGIDRAISLRLKQKKKFNERDFAPKFEKK